MIVYVPMLHCSYDSTDPIESPTKGYEDKAVAERIAKAYHSPQSGISGVVMTVEVVPA